MAKVDLPSDDLIADLRAHDLEKLRIENICHGLLLLVVFLIIVWFSATA